MYITTKVYPGLNEGVKISPKQEDVEYLKNKGYIKEKSENSEYKNKAEKAPKKNK